MVNRENLGKLIAAYRPQLQSFIRKRISNAEDTEDILQDVFYQLVRTVDTAMNPIEQVSAWLYRVAWNAIINTWKKRREEELPAFGYDEEGFLPEERPEIFFCNAGQPATPETEYLRSLIRQEIALALSELPAEQREAFELMELDGLPAKEIAESMGIGVNTLLSRKHYAVVHLRKRLRELYSDILDY
ncbi:MAG: RNA polymerase sigma factor [Tannerellaceae bacterium]|jgi:RNA polymerase sigma factor (sigma-70 family)|nr:RNA polymerase sigma factor [Tannerellaceae bacterium]